MTRNRKAKQAARDLASEFGHKHVKAVRIERTNMVQEQALNEVLARVESDQQHCEATRQSDLDAPPSS